MEIDPKFLDAKLKSDLIGRKAKLWRRVESPYRVWDMIILGFFVIVSATCLILSKLSTETYQILGLVFLFVSYEAAANRARFEALVELIKLEMEEK